jgi:drug/metabolite transporter (DMT)-like permease
MAGLVRALGAALIYAVYIPLLHWLRGPLSAAAASAYVIAGAGVMFLAGATLRGEFHGGLDGAAWIIIAVLALWCTVMTFIAFLNGLAVLGPVRTAIISTFEPFWTAMLGAIVLGQTVGAGTLAGGVLIAGAVLLLQRQPTPT